MRRVTLSVEHRQSLLDQRKERNQRSRNSNAGLATGNPTEVTLHAVDDHDVIQKMKQVHEKISSLEAAI